MSERYCNICDKIVKKYYKVKTQFYLALLSPVVLYYDIQRFIYHRDIITVMNSFSILFNFENYNLLTI